VPASALYNNGRHFGCAAGGRADAIASEASRIFELDLAGHLDLDSLITHHFSFDGVNEAFDVAQRGESGKVLVSIE
jgi:Zn-dependent alcohol dehydrogenase